MNEIPGRRMVSFAAIMLILVGAFNVIDGLVAVAKESYFDDTLLFSGLETWGWFFIAYGAVQMVVGWSVFGGSRLAQWLGIVVAGLNALAQLAFVEHYPAWSLTMVAIDVVVIYALAAHGTVFRDQRAYPELHDGGSRQGATASDVAMRTPRLS